VSRIARPPAFSTITIDKFFGMSQDRSGVELDDREFYDLTNIRNNNIEGLSERPGGIKAFTVTDTTSATGTLAVHTYINDAGTKTYIKIGNDGKTWKSTGGSWSEITSGATTLANANTFIVTMNTKDTGAANSTSGTTTSSDATTITDSGESETINEHVGRVLTVGGEIKAIRLNTADTFAVAEGFDTEPSAAAYTVNPRAQEFFIANGTHFYKCDGTTFTNIGSSNFAYAFNIIEGHIGRLFGAIGTRLHWSDIGVGEHFSKNSMYDFQTPITAMKTIGNVLIIYERNRVTALFGDNPDNFFRQTILEGIGTTCPKSVANYHGLYQFFLNESLGVVVLSAKSLAPEGVVNEPLSISRDYVSDLITAQSAANLQASCAEVDEDHFHLCIDNDWYVLNVKASGKTGFKKWIWTLDDRPDAMDAQVLGHFDQAFVVGPQDNAQIYEIETGSNDDGTTISTVIEKRGWNPGGTASRKKFWALRVIQPVAGSSTTMNFFADPDGTTYGSAIETIDLNAASTDEHRYEFTGNPSDVKNSGRKISYKLTNTSSNQATEIEQIELIFVPGIQH
jgi:hypothetical protein